MNIMLIAFLKLSNVLLPVEFRKIKFCCTENINKIISELSCLLYNEIICAHVAPIFPTDFRETTDEWDANNEDKWGHSSENRGTYVQNNRW